MADETYHASRLSHPPQPNPPLSITSGGGQLYSDSFADPNGNLTPANPLAAAKYYQDSNINNEWRWSITDQVWYASIEP